mmetsp:Transcript_49051/g.116772  ORF Transcript_49051/g.116772 Transcript_49051/m.116772 type:complete len:244 (-) Transcript_49051:35-766(-)
MMAMMAQMASMGSAPANDDEEEPEPKKDDGPVGETARKGKGRGKRAPNAEHCLPTIHPEVEALCKKFNIEDKIVRRLDDVMRTREDSFEEDLKALYEVCETAKKPSGSLMVKIGELERGCFTGAGKLDQCMLTFRSKYKLDDRAHARFVEVCHPRAQKLDDIKRLEKYLKGNQNPSQAILPLLTRIEKDGRLDSPERNKDKDRDRPGGRHRSRSRSRSRRKKDKSRSKSRKKGRSRSRSRSRS